MIRLPSGALELAKWIALACMVLDHVNAVFFARELGGAATILGRVAFPLFALVLGYNMARPGADLMRLVRRLVLFGLLATPAYWYLFGLVTWWPLNVLLTFAVAAFAAWLLREGYRAVPTVLVILGGSLVEYWWPGVALVLSAWWFFAGRTWWRAVPLLGALAALCVLNGNAWALLAVPALLALAWLAPWVPRSPRLFWWFYPAHLAAIAVVVLLVP